MTQPIQEPVPLDAPEQFPEPRAENGSAIRTDSLSRRGFLAAGSLSFVSSSLLMADLDTGRRGSHARRCIFIEMTGGASQLDSFDPKPHAPREVRGPLRAIPTALPGVHFTEGFPHLAQKADQLLLLRTLHHADAPIHETGQQWLRHGSLGSRLGRGPTLIDVVNRAFKDSPEPTPALLLPPGIEQPGGVEHLLEHADDEQRPGYELCHHLLKGSDFEAAIHTSGCPVLAQRLTLAPRLIARGCRLVTIPMFAAPEVPGTWDTHGPQGTSHGTPFDYGGRLGRGFDQAISRLLDDLHGSGLLNDTFVVCAGEMGRTPRLNRRGGRDHWTGCWSALLAGGGLPGGLVIGESDATASTPLDRPIPMAELMATIVQLLGIDPMATLTTDAGVRPFIGHAPLPELLS